MAAADRPARLPLGVAGSGGTDRVRGAMDVLLQCFPDHLIDGVKKKKSLFPKSWYLGKKFPLSKK